MLFVRSCVLNHYPCHERGDRAQEPLNPHQLEGLKINVIFGPKHEAGPKGLYQAPDSREESAK